jgi:hypothetical protein
MFILLPLISYKLRLGMSRCKAVVCVAAVSFIVYIGALFAELH